MKLDLVTKLVLQLPPLLHVSALGLLLVRLQILGVLPQLRGVLALEFANLRGVRALEFVNLRDVRALHLFLLRREVCLARVLQRTQLALDLAVRVLPNGFGRARAGLLRGAGDGRNQVLGAVAALGTDLLVGERVRAQMIRQRTHLVTIGEFVVRQRLVAHVLQVLPSVESQEHGCHKHVGIMHFLRMVQLPLVR